MTPEQIDDFFRRFRKEKGCVRVENGRWTSRRSDGTEKPLPAKMVYALNRLLWRPDMIVTMELSLDENGVYLAEIVPCERDYDRLFTCASEIDRSVPEAGPMKLWKIGMAEPVRRGDRMCDYITFACFRTVSCLSDVVQEMLVREALCATAEMGMTSEKAANDTLRAEPLSRAADDPELRTLIDTLKLHVATPEGATLQ